MIKRIQRHNVRRFSEARRKFSRRFESATSDKISVDISSIDIEAGSSVNKGFTLQSSGDLWLEAWADTDVILRTFNHHDVSLNGRVSMIITLKYDRNNKDVVREIIDEADDRWVDFGGMYFEKYYCMSGSLVCDNGIATLECNSTDGMILVEGEEFEIKKITLCFDLEELDILAEDLIDELENG